MMARRLLLALIDGTINRLWALREWLEPEQTQRWLMHHRAAQRRYLGEPWS